MTTATADREGDILRVRGELDFDSVADLWERVGLLFRTEPIRRIDLSEVSRANSAGVALLVLWLRQARQQRRELVFVNVPAQMRAIIEVADLDTVLPMA